MKLFALLLTMCVISYACATDNKKFKWKEVAGFPNKEISIFINSSPISVDNDHNLSEILISFKKNIKVPEEGKEIYARSIVKQLLTDCKTGETIPFSDAYYATPIPNETDTIISFLNYNIIISNVISIPYNSILYQTICPKFT